MARVLHSDFRYFNTFKKRENCKSPSSLEIPELANTSEDAVSLVSLHSKKRKPLVFDGRSHRITHKKSRFANCLLVGLSQDYLRKLVFSILGSLGNIFTLTCCRFPTFCVKLRISEQNTKRKINFAFYFFYSNLGVGAGNNVDEAMSSSKKVLQTIHSVLLLYSCL